METRNSNIIFLLFGFICFFSLRSNGQLIVDAGKDTTYCTGVGKLYLGNNVAIKNGVEPYSISWECKVPKGLYSFFTASDLLSDTTAISPFITYTPTNNEWIKFTLHITDSQNNSAEDSIRVRFSTFGYLTGYGGTEIKKGDSILLRYSSVGGGIEPLKFHWQPETGLSNPDSLVTWCKPDFTTLYDITVTDACGCVSSPNTAYYVMVQPTGLDEIKNDEGNSLNIRQDGKLIYFNNPFKQETHIALYSVNGEVRYNLAISEDHFEPDKLLKNEGIYVVKISLGGKVGGCKFLKIEP